ncbi:hypothetical protein [Maribacter sp. R77961]|uniref:hypothetical protein n=1 Tax=Maribacter sp. R77961 TaxID=3093871 RepID=UPI0037C78CBE
MKKNLFALLLFNLLLSCENIEKTNEILLFNEDINQVDISINDQKIVLDTSNQFTKLNLKNGFYKIGSEKIYSDSIRIDNDFLITKNDNQFVVFPVYYTSKPLSESSAIFEPSGPIIIDKSIVIFDAQKFDDINELIDGIEIYNDSEKIRTEKGHTQSRKNEIPKLRLVKPIGNKILKSWNYTLQDLPENIEIRKNSVNQILGASKSHEVVTELRNFMYISKETELFKGVRVLDSTKLDIIKEYLKTRYGINN